MARVTDKTALTGVDQIIGVQDGSVGPVARNDLALQLVGAGAIAQDLAAIRAQVTSGLLAPQSWAALEALTATVDATGAEVPLSDTGTHLAATATGYDGPEVPNHGRFSWHAGWARWVRIGEYGGAVSDVILTAGGTGDGITAVSDRDHSRAPFAAKYVMPITSDNTGPVTMDIDGGTASALVTNTGAPLVAGELLAGQVVEFRWTGTEYRLIPGITVAAMVQRAEAARDVASQSRSDAEHFAALAGSYTGEARYFETRAAVSALTGFYGRFLVGQRLQVAGFSYEVAPLGAVSDLTLGEAVLHVVPSPSRCLHAEAFGVTPGDGVDNTAPMQRVYDAAIRHGAIADSGGPPTIVLPRGVIELSCEYVMVHGLRFVGQGMAITNTAVPGDDTSGTMLVLNSPDALFYTGEATGGTLRASTNCQLMNFTVVRGAAYQGVSGTRGLIDGHGASRWVLINLSLIAGQSPAIHLTEAWDVAGQNVTVSHSGEPDGLAAVTLINSDATSQDGNSSRWENLRIEACDGPHLRTEGNHHYFAALKVHAPSNSAGVNSDTPVVSLGKNSLISLGQMVNFTTNARGNVNRLIELAGEGASVVSTIFRSNTGVQLITITGNNTFAGGGVVMGNAYDEGGSGTYLIQDNRTGSGRAMTLGPRESWGYSGAPGNNQAANKSAAFHAGGTPLAGYRPTAYLHKPEKGQGAALHAVFGVGSGGDNFDLAALIQSGNYQRPVAIIEQTRDDGNTQEELQIRTGKPGTDGRNFITGYSDTGGVLTGGTRRFCIRHDGAYRVNDIQVLTAQQPAVSDPVAVTSYAAPAISDPPTQAEVQAIANALALTVTELASTRAQVAALLGTTRTHGLIAS